MLRVRRDYDTVLVVKEHDKYIYHFFWQATRKPPSPTIWRYLQTWQVKVRTGRAEIAAESGKSVSKLKISLQEHHDMYCIFCKVNMGFMYFVHL